MSRLLKTITLAVDPNLAPNMREVAATKVRDAMARGELDVLDPKSAANRANPFWQDFKQALDKADELERTVIDLRAALASRMSAPETGETLPDWTRRDLEALTGASKATLYRWMDEKGFPRAVGGRWHSHEVLLWWKRNRVAAKSGWRS